MERHPLMRGGEALVALGVATLVYSVLRRNGKTPPRRGGWTELTPEMIDTNMQDTPYVEE